MPQLILLFVFHLKSNSLICDISILLTHEVWPLLVAGNDELEVSKHTTMSTGCHRERKKNP